MTKTISVLIPGAVAILGQIWLAINETRPGVQALYFIVAIGIAVLVAMLISSFRSRGKNKEIENLIRDNRQFITNSKTAIGSMLKDLSSTYAELESTLLGKDDEKSQKILSTIKGLSEENKRLLEKLERI